MKLHPERMKAVHGYEEGRVDAVDPDSSMKALAYKREVLKRFVPLDARQIETRLSGERFCVTRKYDGEYAFIIHDHGQTVTINRSGRVRCGIPCIVEAGRLLEAAGIARAMLGAEIYADTGEGRERSGDLLSALADRKRAGRLRLAVFDLVELEDKPWRADYARTWRKLHRIFGSGTLVREVEMQTAATPAGVRGIYEEWVVRGDAEGVVVHGDLPFVYKIKPRHSIDAVVVGFSEGAGAEKGQARSLLLALMPREGQYQIVGRVGSGMDVRLRRKLFGELSKHILPSEFVETDADFVAFRMVRPDTVVEITVGDLLSETDAGPKTNTLLAIDRGAYRIAGTVAGVKFVAPVFVRIRKDKGADAADVRLAQVGRFASLAAEEPPPSTAPAALPVSRLLFRDVYVKNVGAKTMIRKFMVWKTNKELTGDYPAYVLYVADVSTGRMQPLQRDVDVSDSPVQIRRLLMRSLERNIGNGWRKVSSLTGERGTETTDTAGKARRREKVEA